MPILALIGGIFFIFVGITGKGRAFKSKMGTPLSAKEVKTVKFTYIIVGALLLLVALINGIELLSIA
ncbi:MAG: hypothetical protein J6C96_03685 [Oscillospiraceae bacterium]|nr:hypothetical protein [Oscillospiraceae bacterium]